MNEEVYVFPTSFAQQRLWFLDQLNPGLPVYNVSSVIEFEGHVDRVALEGAWTDLVVRHESLRTTFDGLDGEPVQVIARAPCSGIEFADLRSHETAVRETTVAEMIEERSAWPFDLKSGPLSRATFVSLTDDEHLLILVQHHIVTDGWSCRVLERDLRAAYARRTGEDPGSSPRNPIQYADFAVWQRQRLAGSLAREEMAWWKRRLAGIPAFLALPTDRERPSIQTFAGSQRAFRLPGSSSGALKRFAQSESLTPFLVALATFKALLSRYAGHDDVVVGTPVAGRSHAELEGIVGCFVNTLVLRTDLSGTPTFRELAGRVRDVALEAFAHQDVPFEKLVAESAPDRHLGHAPIVQVMFTLDAADGATEEDTAAVSDELTLAEPVPCLAKFDLTLALTDAPEGLAGVLETNADLFDDATAERFIRYFARMLDEGLARPDEPVATLALAPPDEVADAYARLNATGRPYPRDATIDATFDLVAAKTPDAIAVAEGARRSTYGELGARAGLVASAIVAEQASRGAPVGLMLDRSTEMIVGMLGILKAGCAYVPLDPGYPVDRIQGMVSDLGIQVVATLRRHEAAASALARHVVFLDPGEFGVPSPAAGNPALIERAPTEVACVLFTSGSTGRPKGVQVLHRGILRLTCGTDYVQVRQGDRVVHASNPSFDAATLEVWTPLLNGATIVVVDRDLLLSTERFAAFIQEERIATLFLTTALFNRFAAEKPDAFGALRDLLFGGEAVDPKSVRRVLASGAPPARLLHVYGPTECTTLATWHLVQDVGEEAATVPIGRPIANTEAYLVDSRGGLVPPGIPGEVYLAGDGLAGGYHGRDAETRSSFVHHPVRGAVGETAYRTGDRARIDSRGNIEFIGRLDDQVKIRGFRIEPAEVEATLGRAAGVHEVIVTAPASPRGGRELVAYYTCRPEHEVSVSTLRAFARGQLPEHMVPSVFMRIETLPLTPNGKVDRRSLPVPDWSGGTRAGPSEAPASTLERTIVAIWQDILRVPEIGVNDNFFDLGGHSLLLVKVHNRLRDAGHGSLAMLDLFRYPTVGTLARHLGGAASAERPLQGVADRADQVREALALRQRVRMNGSASGHE